MKSKSILHWAAAAAVSVGGFAFAPNTLAQDTTAGQKVDSAVESTKDTTDRAVDKTKDATDRAVDKTKETARELKGNWDQGRIHTMLKQVTEASLTKGGFDDLVERLNDADRNRISAFVKDEANKEKLAKLDGRIAQFQKDWKAKYGQDFNIESDKMVFGNEMFRIRTGELGTDARVAGQKLPPTEKVTVDNLDKPKDATGNTAADKNIEPGRNVAYVTVAESHGLPEVKVPLIHELPDLWKIDAPDSVDGQKLYDNLLNHLTMANEMKDKWPANVNDAYREVAHHVLMAVMDVSHDAKAAGAKIGADSAKPLDK
jgi:hypothetical protein